MLFALGAVLACIGVGILIAGNIGAGAALIVLGLILIGLDLLISRLFNRN